MHKTLVIMAAGMGSRFGGNKQVTGFGPHDEWLCEYSAYDAMRAGFNRIVFIIKPDMLDMVKARVSGAMDSKIEVCYTFQDYSSLPSFYKVPEGRVKPYGTLHAVLCAEKCVDGPFAVLNADDVYGADAFPIMSAALDDLADEGEAVMVAYQLKHTVSINGSVTRGICSVENGMLTGVAETKKIVLRNDGRIFDMSADDGTEGVELDPDAPVSMNFWGFRANVFEMMHKDFDERLKAADPADLKCELLLPDFVDHMMKMDKLSVKVKSTDCKWFGVTYADDKPAVIAKLKALHDSGTYPAAGLWK